MLFLLMSKQCYFGKNDFINICFCCWKSILFDYLLLCASDLGGARALGLAAPAVTGLLTPETLPGVVGLGILHTQTLLFVLF